MPVSTRGPGPSASSASCCSKAWARPRCPPTQASTACDVGSSSSAKGPARAPRSREDALRRLSVVHGRVDPAVLERKLEHLLVEEPDGSLRWAYDPLHRTLAPYRFDVEVFTQVLEAITCPTLFIGGGPDGFHPEDEAARLARIAGPVTRLDLEDAGHMLHWTRPREVAAAWLDFVDRAPA
ncbi:MAG: alpha/beta hydrolase [Polyangiaceae bacterium]